MIRKKLETRGWILFVIFALAAFSGCDQTQVIEDSEAPAMSESSSSTVEPASEDSESEDSVDEEPSSVFNLLPFDDSDTLEDYRLVSSNVAAAGEGIYIIDPRQNLQYINGTYVNKLGENVLGISGITSEWIYCTIASNPNADDEPILKNLVRISLTDGGIEAMLEIIDCAIYSAVQDRIYYCKMADFLELHALDLATGEDTLIFTDEGAWTFEDEGFEYATYGWFHSQSDGTVALAWAYPYPACAPYCRYLKIDSDEIVSDSENSPWEVEFSNDMTQEKVDYYKNRYKANLTQLRYGTDRKLALETVSNPARYCTLFYEQNGEREQVVKNDSWIYNFAYCYNRVYFNGYKIDLTIYDLDSKETTSISLDGIRNIFAINNQLYAFLSNGDDYQTYQLVELNQDAEIVKFIYEQTGDFFEGLGAQGVRAIQIDDYIVLSTYYWSEDELSFCWCYNTQTGESVEIEM